MQELVDAGHLQQGADQGEGRRSLISFTPARRRHSLKVARTFEASILRHFIDPLDDEDSAAIVRILDKLRAAQAQELAPVSSSTSAKRREEGFASFGCDPPDGRAS